MWSTIASIWASGSSSVTFIFMARQVRRKKSSSGSFLYDRGGQAFLVDASFSSSREIARTLFTDG